MTEDTIKKYINWIEKIQEALGFTSHLNDIKYTLENCLSIFKRAKFKLNDRVQLNKTPKIDNKERWGWSGFKHILIKSAPGKITEVGFYDGSFRYLVCFDKDTYISSTTNKEEPRSGEPKHFTFYENWLEPEGKEELISSSLNAL